MLKVPGIKEEWTEFFIYVIFVILLASISCLITLTTKTVVPSTYRISTLDENLAALPRRPDDDEVEVPKQSKAANLRSPPMVYYSASGSGVAEVKVILSGFVLHGFLGLKTLIIKTCALVLSVASGLSLGKEGPFVHIAACVGNIACRLFNKYDYNDGKRREILSAAAASGVAVAFGAPIGGVLFSLEEASYFFPAKTLFRTFFCCVTAALSLKFLNPYGTGKIVMFEVRYVTDWELFEMVPFLAVAVLGGAAGALFIKASSIWARSFRRITVIKRWPLLEVVCVALITGLICYWNDYTRAPVAKLLFNLASPCTPDNVDTMGLCPRNIDEIGVILKELSIGFVIKSLLTIITFGIVCLPCPKHLPICYFFQHADGFIESTCWHICTFDGRRWSIGKNSWPCCSISCSAVSQCCHFRRLCSSSVRNILHHSGSVRLDWRWCNHVWCYSSLCDTRSYTI